MNHSCDPNFTIVNYGRRAIAVAVRKIKEGMQVHDSYGAVWYHMDRSERQRFLKVSKLFLRLTLFKQLPNTRVLESIVLDGKDNCLAFGLAWLRCDCLVLLTAL